MLVMKGPICNESEIQPYEPLRSQRQDCQLGSHFDPNNPKTLGKTMKAKLIISTLAMLATWPFLQADNVTVHGSLGMLDGRLMTKDMESVGSVNVWNTTQDFNLEVLPADGYLISKVYVFINPEPPPPPLPDGKTVEPDFGEWPVRVFYKKDLAEVYSLKQSFEDELDFEWGHWGPMWLEERLLTVGVQVELKTDEATPVTVTAWAFNPNVPLEVQRTAWGDNALAMRYEVQHPEHGQFVIGPVSGLGYATRTQADLVNDDGGFWFFPGETVLFYIGDVEIGFAEADQRVTPLDIFPGSDIDDPSVVNMARLMMTLDADGESNGAISITQKSVNALNAAMAARNLEAIPWEEDGEMLSLLTEINIADPELQIASAEDAAARLEQSVGNLIFRRNISKSPEYPVDKPKLDIFPIWVPARSANGSATTVEYTDPNGNKAAERDRVKPLVVTYTEVQDANPAAGITRQGADIITAVSLDDGATWRRFNISKSARKSSFTLPTGEKFPGDNRGPQQKIAEDKILITWTSAYARGGKPSFSIRTDDDYPYDDAYVVEDYFGVRGRQGSVDYDEDKDVGDQGIGVIPYYALWACRGVLIWDGDKGNIDKYRGMGFDVEAGDILWFKPERLTSGRRDANFNVSSSAKNVGFAVAWQEDPGGLLPGSCKGGGHGWSGATVHKKTDIWYSYIPYSDFDRIDTNFDPELMSHGDEHGDLEAEDPDLYAGHRPDESNRPKWLVPMSIAVRVSDNNTVNTDNMKVQLDPESGLPLVDPETGSFIPLAGAIEEDYEATEHEGEGNCGSTAEEIEENDGSSGAGGGWGMARYAYMMPALNIADQTTGSTIWDKSVDGEYRPVEGLADNSRWFRFINKPGMVKTVAVTEDGRPLDGDTGAARPNLFVMPGGWVILGYEESKGMGEPPEGEHEDGEEDPLKPEAEDSGKNIIYHSFKLNQPDMVSGGNIMNLPALDDNGELIPIYYKDADGENTDVLHTYKYENARRVRFMAQPKPWIGDTRTSVIAIYKQGREGQGKPSDVFAVRAVVPEADMANSKANPYQFSNFQRFEAGASSDDPQQLQFRRRHMNMSSVQNDSFMDIDADDAFAGDGEGHSWRKVAKFSQKENNMSDESFANPYSEAKAHRGFLRGDTVVFGYSFTPNWGRLGGDHMDFYVRRSFDGGQTWTTDPNGPEEVVHTVIEKTAHGVYEEKQYRYGRGEFEPGRNVSLLKGNSHTVGDPRLVPPMGPGTVNPTYPEDDTYDWSNSTYHVAFGTQKVLHGIGDPATTDTEAEDIYYTRTTDGGSTWLTVEWEVNPDSSSPIAGETVDRFPWLAHGTPHQGHAQLRAHPSGTRLYAIWHQWTDGDEGVVSPHDMGDDIWFRRIDFMEAPVEAPEETPQE